jgi:TolB-like protein/Tfp pilus assembly protein PilF
MPSFAASALAALESIGAESASPHIKNNAMSAPLPEPGPADRTSHDRLDSWKAIAAYLKRDVTTVQRWERRERMPVHRHVHDKRGSVYALASELDAWRQSRRQLLDGDAGHEGHTNGAGTALPEQPTALQGVPPQRGRPWMWWLLPLAAMVVVVAAVIAYVLHRHALGSTAAAKISSIAVLPLRNLSGDPSQEYLADGMTEELIGRLAQVQDLRVISHTSVMRFKDPQLSVPEIAKALHVDAIVEGSVMRSGNRIRVAAQLIRAATDEHFWSETYDRELRDVLTLQSELAQDIAEKVEVTITGAEHIRLSSAGSVEPEVYESYLKGRFAYNGATGRASIESSIAYFQNAIRLDPTFAPAYMGLAVAFTSLGTVATGGSPDVTRPQGVAAARKALELDPTLAEAHALLANLLQEQWHWADAELEYRRALDLSPNDAKTHAIYAMWLLCQGRTNEAVDWVRRARQLDPLVVSGEDVAWILFQSHRFAEAEREGRSVLAVQPSNSAAMNTMGFVLSADNRSAEAIPFLERSIAVSHGNPAATGVLIRAYALAGRREDALRLLAELQKRSEAGYVPAAAFVNGYLGLGDTEQAFVWLERAYKEQSNILQFLKVHPYFDPIRGDPRFADLVRRVFSESSVR